MSTFKRGLPKICCDPTMLREAVERCSRIEIEAGLLGSYLILRLLRDGEAIPEMNQTFFNQLLAVCKHEDASEPGRGLAMLQRCRDRQVDEKRHRIDALVRTVHTFSGVCRDVDYKISIL